MKLAVLLRCGLALGLLCAAPFACGRSDGTYVLLKFDGSAAGKDIGRIDVQLQFGTRTDSASFAAPAGTSINLPTTAALQIRSGQGDLAVVATARAADGSPLASGSGYGRVVDGQTATVAVSFVATATDAGVDGGADQPEAGRDPGSNDGAVPGQGGAGGASLSGGGGANVGAGGASLSGGGGANVGAGGTAGMTALGSGGTGGSVGSGGNGGSLGSGGATVPDAAATSDAAVIVDAKPPLQLSLSSTTLDFGPTVVGGVSAPQSLTVTNVGSAVGPPLSVFVNDGHHFPLYQDRCSGATLAPGNSCTLAFTFNPDAPGALQTDGAVTGGAQRAAFFLRGTGTSSASTLSLSPNSVDFNNVDIGVDVPITFTVTNQAATDSGVIKVSASPTASFQITNDHCAQTTLAQLGQCTFTLVFAPRTLGPVSGTILAESATSSATSTATGVGQDHVQLTIQFAGTGGGSVSGPNLNCRSAVGSCNLGVTRTDPNSFPTINLSALSNTLSVFAGWSGGGCTGTGSCAAVMDTSKTVTAKFNTL
jgi:hypothetical protein